MEAIQMGLLPFAIYLNQALKDLGMPSKYCKAVNLAVGALGGLALAKALHLSYVSAFVGVMSAMASSPLYAEIKGGEKKEGNDDEVKITPTVD